MKSETALPPHHSPFDRRFDFVATVAIETGHWFAQQARVSSGRGDRARVYFSALADLFELYASPENWKSGTPRRELPRPLAQFVAHQARYLAAGKIPEPIADCARRGGVVGPDELRDIRRAVVYLDAVERKVIADPTPEKTIAKLYGVGRTTVLGWSKAHAITDDERARSPRLIRTQMKHAASRYSEAGRSRAAVARRDKKRKRPLN